LHRVARAGGTLSLGILGSRVLGLVRDMARAYLLGTGMAADAWVIAYRLPNLLRAFFAEGSLSAAFVPVLSRAIETRSRDEVWRLVNAVLSILLVVLSGVTLMFVLGASLYVPLLAPGFDDVAGKLGLTVWLTRATFPYLILIGVATLFMGTLNAFHHFRAPALAPGVMNLFMIGALLGVCPFLGEDPAVQVKGLALGVVAGGIAQLAIQLPPLWRRGFRPRFDPDWRHPDVRRIATLMLPGLVGIGVTEINAVVDTILGSLLEPGSVASLEYGMRLMHLPLGVIGVALGTAILPTLSRLASRAEWTELRETYALALRLVLFLMAPAALVLVLLPREIVALLFQRGAFTGGSSTDMTTMAVAFYGSGLLFYGAVKVTVPVFFSLQDTRTPVWCSAAALVANVILNLLLMGPLRLGGLALATALSAGLNLALLLIALRRRVGIGHRRAILHAGGRVAVGIVAAALAMLGLRAAAGLGVDAAGLDAGGLLARALAVFVPLTGGAAAYLGVAMVLRSEEWHFLRSVVSNRRTSTPKPSPPGEGDRR
jgi:putative peptidoglycan lipid II flippase